MTTVIIIIAVVLLVLLFFLCAKSVRKNYQKMSQPGNFVDGAEPIKNERAKIIDMQPVMETYRPDIMTPDHRVRYMVSFETEDGAQKTLEVDEATYDGFSVSQAGVLVTQDNHVIDFAAGDDF